MELGVIVVDNLEIPNPFINSFLQYVLCCERTLKHTAVRKKPK